MYRIPSTYLPPMATTPVSPAVTFALGRSYLVFEVGETPSKNRFPPHSFNGDAITLTLAIRPQIKAGGYANATYRRGELSL